MRVSQPKSKRSKKHRTRKQRITVQPFDTMSGEDDGRLANATIQGDAADTHSLDDLLPPSPADSRKVKTKVRTTCTGLSDHGSNPSQQHVTP